MWFTHRLQRVENFLNLDSAGHSRNYDVEFRDSGATSLWIDPEEELDF